MDLTEVFKFLLTNYLFLFSFFFAGHFLISFYKTSTSSCRIIFIKILFGLIIVVSAYALIKSGFRTYLLTLIPLSAFFIYYLRNHFNLTYFKYSVLKLDLKHILTVFFILTIVYFITVLSVVNFNGELYDLHDDFAFYGGVSEILHKVSIESTNFDAALSGIKHFEFYHYFELWFGALAIELFNIKSIQAIILIVFVIFASMSVYGVYVLLNDSNKFRANILSLSFLILIVSPFVKTIRWLFGLYAGDSPFNISLISNLSIKSGIIITMLSFLFMYRKNDTTMIGLIILLISLIYPSTIPLLLPSLLFWLILMKLKYKSDVFLLISSSVAIFITFVFIIYLGISDEIKSTSVLYDIIISHFKTNTINVISEPMIRLIWEFITNFPYIILFFLYIRSTSITYKHFYNIKSILLFLIIGYVVGAIGIAMLSFTDNGHQLLSNFYDPFFVLSATVLLIKSVILSKSFVKCVSFSIIIILFIVNIPKIFISKETINNESYEKIIDVYRRNNGEISFVHQKKYTYFKVPFGNVRWFVRDYFPSNMSLNYIKLNSLSDKFEHSKSIVNAKYYDDLVLKNKSISQIITENKTKYLIVENNFVDSLDFNGKLNFDITELYKYRLYEFNYQK